MMTHRLLLRPWQDEDISLFAAMNQDPRVMEFFPALLTHEESVQRVAYYRHHFTEHGFGLWAVELKATREFIGFVGLAIPTFAAQFTPCVEIGWRLAFNHWDQGYATEAARRVLGQAFYEQGLKEVVSFTPRQNLRSQKVMQKLGMIHTPQDDFDHPSLPKDHPLARHVLYRYTEAQLKTQDAVTIEPYNPAWPNLAAREIQCLRSYLNSPEIMDIAHVGSTAIPGLSAKPVIDLAMAVTNLEVAKTWIPRLAAENYIFWRENPDPTRLFFAKDLPPYGPRRTCHLHITEATHPQWQSKKQFRDYLIAHPEVQKAYTDLKYQLSLEFPEDREAYTEAKGRFVEEILQRFNQK